MDQRKHHLQHLGICYKLYYFITNTLASQALKKVTLGCSTHYGSTSTATAPNGSGFEADKVVRLGIQTPCNKAEDKDSPCMKTDEMVREDVARLSKRISLKKSVSICDNVEEILLNKKNKKRSKSLQKSSSLDQEEEEEPKTLRSILKVASDLKDKSS